MYGEEAKKSSFLEYLHHVTSVSGHEVDDETYEKSVERRDLKSEISEYVARQLEKGGVPAYDYNQTLHVVGASGNYKEIPSYRNIIFIPDVAGKRRAEMLKTLEYFCETKVNEKQLRMWVFNLGHRTRLSNVRERTMFLHKKLNQLAFEAKHKYGIEIFFRSTELGEMKKTEDNTPTFHLHTHCLVRTPYIQDWSEAISWVNRRWRKLCKLSPNSSWCVFKESGSIYKVREACKYVIKPMELLELNSSELCELFYQMKGLHLVQSRGDFKACRADLKVTSKKPVRRFNGEQVEWRIITNVNRKTDAERELIRVAKLCATGESAPRDNVILSLLEPSTFFSKTFEPAFLVSNFTPDFFRLQGWGRNEKADDIPSQGWFPATCSAVLDAYETGCAIREAVASGSVPGLYKVHNRSTTVKNGKTDKQKAADLTFSPPN